MGNLGLWSYLPMIAKNIAVLNPIISLVEYDINHALNVTFNDHVKKINKVSLGILMSFKLVSNSDVISIDIDIRVINQIKKISFMTLIGYTSTYSKLLKLIAVRNMMVEIWKCK